MLLLGFFFLIAKYTNPKLWGEEESEAMRQGEGLQRGAELPGKEKEKLKEKERRREKGADKTGKYNFKDSGIGDSWLIGTDTTSDANAYVNGMDGCELNLIIPHELTDDSGNTKKVEVIGQYAFNTCGDKDYTYGITRSIVLSRYIKVIKRYGLGAMDDVTSFRIEEGSCLESIESYGLCYMSYLNKNDDARRSILVLPSTVTSIAVDGIHYNNLIKTIYYCGSTHLSNYSQLMNNVSAPDIKVTSLYTYDTIFRDYKPNKDNSSIAEAEEKCRNFAHKPKNFTSVHVEDGAKITGWGDGKERCPPLINIPEVLDGVTVVAVSDSAFSGCNESKSFSLPRSLERVGREAFARCGANADAGFVLTIPSGANLSEGSFTDTNVELVVWIM